MEKKEKKHTCSFPGIAKQCIDEFVRMAPDGPKQWMTTRYEGASEVAVDAKRTQLAVQKD